MSRQDSTLQAPSALPPVASRAAALVLERIELPCPLCGLLPGLFLRGALGLDAPCGIGHGEGAECFTLACLWVA